MSDEFRADGADGEDVPFGPLGIEIGIPVLEFPPRLIDSGGRRVRPGSTVALLDGRRGEVTAWRGGERVEVIVDDDDDLDVEVVIASDLTVVPILRRHPLTIGSHIRSSGEPQKVTLIQPLGGRDLVSIPGVEERRLPTEESFRTRRGHQTKVDARRFGQACLDVVREVPIHDRSSVVARELDAPLLRRALEETVLPQSLARLVLLATDQVDSPHVDDTAPFAELIELWVRGTAGDRLRDVRDIEVVTLRHLPHRVDFVVEQVIDPIRRFALDTDEFVVVQAGGTPAMSFGVLAAVMTGLDVRVRHVQVPVGQAVVELDFPRTVRRSQITTTIEALVRVGNLKAAVEVAESLGFTSTAELLRAGGATSEWQMTLDDRL